MKKLFILLIVLIFPQMLFSYENFRVHKTFIVDMTDEVSSAKAILEVNDALVIKVPKNPTFLKALSIEVKIPPEVAEFRDSVAYFLYSDVRPEPSEKYIDYKANRLFINTFPTRLSCNLLVPLFSSVELKDSPYSIVLPSAMDDNSGYVFFRLQLVMKGTPVNIWDSSFVIDVKPVLEDKGFLDLNIFASKDTSLELNTNDANDYVKQDKTTMSLSNINDSGLYTLYIDGKIPSITEDKILLPSGSHHISIVSDLYRNEVRTVVIEQASTTKLDIVLQDITPLVEISAPAGVEIFLDSEKLTDWQEPFPVSEGEHLLKFTVGGYEKIQSFEAFNGKTYKFSLNLEVQLIETE